MVATEAGFLIVRVAGRLYGFPVGAVCEVLRVPALLGGFSATVPGLLGMAQLRGELVPVLELAELLEIPPGVVEAGLRRVVRMELAQDKDGATRRVGFAVDAVLGVYRLAAEKLEAIALPGGEMQRWGKFDVGFAQMLERGGVVSEELLEALAGAGSGTDAAAVAE